MPHQRTRANGEGTIYQNANGTYTAQITTPAGRRSHTDSTQRKARSWLTQQRRDLDTGDFIEPSDMTLGSWWDQWVETYKKRSVSASTLSSYKASRSRLPQSLLAASISSITRTDIQSALNALSDSGRSRRTIEITRTALQMCMEQALEDSMIRRNPVKKTTLPDDDHKESVPLTKEEEQKLIRQLSVPVYITSSGSPSKFDLASQTIRDALLLILYTGLRRGECISLKWSDVKGDMLHVAGTKTEASNRMVPLSADARALLARRKFTANSEWIFATRNGKPLDGTNLYRWMRAHTGHTVHNLRHTYCTRAAQAGINPKVLQTITGHAKVETLLNIYTHVTEQDKRKAAAKISSYCKSTANAEK